MKAKCFSALALFVILTVPSVQAQVELPPQFCFVDGFAFVWDVAVTGCPGGNCSLTGTVNVGGSNWAASGTVNKNTGAATLIATNPNPDNCTTQSGMFTYTGTFVPVGGGTYNGSGNWTNDCGLSGTWTGTATRGACRTSGQPVAGVTPAMGQDAAAVASATTPSGYALGRSAPNPFTEATSVSYEVPEAAHVRLAVYDVLGREVAVLVDEVVDAGTHTARFSGMDLPAGTYVYRIQAGTYTEARQMMLVK